MWRLDVDGLPSPELSRVKEATVASFFCGAIWGAYTHSQRIMKIFLEKNKHEVRGIVSSWAVDLHPLFCRSGSSCFFMRIRIQLKKFCNKLPKL